MEKESQIFLREAGNRARVASNGSVKYQLLLFLQLEDLLLNSIRDNKPSRDNWLPLSETMSAVDGLHFSGGVPPRIHQEDTIGDG